MYRLKRTRWSYASFAALVAMIGVFCWHIVLGFLWLEIYKEGIDAFLTLFPWIIYATVSAMLVAALIWPRNNAPSRTRMALSGIFITACVMLILAVVYGWYNPDFPNGAIDPDERASIGEAFDIGIVVMIGMSVLSLGIPYAVAALVSLKFAKNKTP